MEYCLQSRELPSRVVCLISPITNDRGAFLYQFCMYSKTLCSSLNCWVMISRTVASWSNIFAINDLTLLRISKSHSISEIQDGSFATNARTIRASASLFFWSFFLVYILIQSKKASMLCFFFPVSFWPCNKSIASSNKLHFKANIKSSFDFAVLIHNCLMISLLQSLLIATSIGKIPQAFSADNIGVTILSPFFSIISNKTWSIFILSNIAWIILPSAIYLTSSCFGNGVTICCFVYTSRT